VCRFDLNHVTSPPSDREDICKIVRLNLRIFGEQIAQRLDLRIVQEFAREECVYDCMLQLLWNETFDLRNQKYILWWIGTL
jgi:hypothetical protein